MRRSTLVGCTGCAGVSSGTNQNDMEFVSTGGKDIERAVQADDVFSLNSNPNYSFNPLIATNLSNQLICDLVYENMVEVDDNFEVIPNVITTWTHSDDCKTWTLNIGEGHVFHDGTPVTAKDLRYSLDRAITADRYLGRFASYQGAYVANDTQLVVSLGLGDGQFISWLNIPIIKSGLLRRESTPSAAAPIPIMRTIPSFTPMRATPPSMPPTAASPWT